MSLFGTNTNYATTTTNSGPWGPQQGQLNYLFQQARGLYNQGGPNYYPKSTVAGFNGQQNTAFRQANNVYGQNNQAIKAGMGYLQNTMQNEPTDPYQGQVFRAMEANIRPSVNSQFSSGGRYGSGAHAGRTTEALTNSFAPYASQMYEQGQQRRMQAAGMMPAMANARWDNNNSLMAYGDKRQQLAQNQTNDAVNRWNFYQNRRANNLGQFQGFIGGNYGGVTSQSTPYQTPGAGSQVLGGLLGLAGLFG